MDSTGLVIYIFLFFLGAVCGLIWIILLIIGCVKKSKKRIIKSFIPVGVFAIITVNIFVYDAVKRHDFNKIPCLEVKNDTVTILTLWHKGLNSNFQYVLAEEDESLNIVVRDTEKNTQKFKGNVYIPAEGSILTEIDKPFHMNHAYIKSGYTFKINDSGTAYVCMLVREFGDISYLDIYKVTSDDTKAITVDKVKHIKCDDKFRNELPEEFSFVFEAFDDLNKKLQ